MFDPKLTNLSPFVDPTESSIEPKYDTQNISTSGSKKLYVLREKMSQQTLQLVENQQETLMSQNCSSIEIYRSAMNEVNSCKSNHQNQVQDDGNKASND
jgi:hypothetical protein